MFKKIKENEGYKKYKEFKKDPQNSARLSLLFWCLLFIIIIIFTRVNFSETGKSIKQYSIKNYEYVLYNDKVKIIGSYYNGKHDFVFNNSKYYYNGNIYEVTGHELNKSDFNLNLFKIDYSFIDNLTKNVNYTENGYKRYLVSLTNFISIYDGDTPIDLSGTDNYNIVIDKYFDGDVLKTVKIDLSNYYKYKGTVDEGILTIDLYNVGRINDFSSEYEKMIGVK